MKITVCIGSSCHIKGSRQVVEMLQKLIAEKNLSDKVDLSGTFCMGKCQQGVCVTVDGEFFSVDPESVTGFFEETVLKTNSPVFLTKNGYGTMVLMSVEQYSALTDNIEHKLDEADAVAAKSDVRYSASEVFDRARRFVSEPKRV